MERVPSGGDNLFIITSDDITVAESTLGKHITLNYTGQEIYDALQDHKVLIYQEKREFEIEDEQGNPLTQYTVANAFLNEVYYTLDGNGTMTMVFYSGVLEDNLSFETDSFANKLVYFVPYGEEEVV